jgi:hypothetical protein
MPRLVISFLVFVAIVGVADLHGWGHGYLWIICATLWFLTCWSHFEPRQWDLIWINWLWLSVPVAAISVIQMFFMKRAHGVFLSANFLGSYAALNLCLAMRRIDKSPRWVAIVPLIANVISLTLAQSRGAFAAAAVSGVIMLWRRFPWVVVLGLLICINFVVVATLHRGTDDPRLGLWRIGFYGALARPWLGWGQGGLMAGYTGLTVFYNIAIEWLAAAGVIGLSAALWVYGEGVRAARRDRAALGFLAAFAVQGMFLYGTWVVYLPLVTLLAELAQVPPQIYRSRQKRGAKNCAPA